MQNKSFPREKKMITKEGNFFQHVRLEMIF